MKRRHAFECLACLASLSPALAQAAAPAPARRSRPAAPPPLPKTPGQPIRVAFVLDPGTELVDFAGPWGVFEYVRVPGWQGSPFELFTVAEGREAFKVSGGLTVQADHRFADAPPAQLIVVPALGEEPSPALLDWLRRQAPASDMTFSVCNGVFVLARAGLLDGLAATGHHGAFGVFRAEFPQVSLRRGARFVDNGRVASSGGLSAGVDLALHVVARYFGKAAAEQTARQLEYQGQGWRNPDSNRAFARKPVSTAMRPLCPVCEAALTPAEALPLAHGGRTLRFCSDWCRDRFLRDPKFFLQG